MLSSEDFKSLVFNMLIEGTLDYAIFMLDKEGNVISWNSGAEKIFGYQENEIIEKNIATFFTFKDNQKNIAQLKIKQCIVEGRVEYDNWCVRKNGQRFWCIGMMGSLQNAQGELQGFVQIMRDNTKRHIVEKKTIFLLIMTR